MKKIVVLLLLAILLIFIINSLQAIHELWSKRQVLLTTEQSLKKVKQENSALHAQLKKVSSQDFVEEEARNKLFLVKKDESTVFIAKDLLTPTVKKSSASRQVPNWEQWLHVFF